MLLIDDDAAFRRTVVRVLQANGFATRSAASGRQGVSEALARPPQLVLLDLVLPGMQGLEVCQALKEREETSGVPILVLTGNDREGLDVTCLDMGADAYLTKPVKTERLLAHCRALIRLAAGEAPARGRELRVGDLALSFERKLVSLGGRDYPNLTPMEFGLLYELVRRSPEPASREALYREVWGIEAPSEGALKTVEVHVRRVRLKLQWRSDGWLRTVSGRGYCVAPPA